MSLTILGIGLLILAACGKDDETQGQLVPTIIPDPSPTATIAFISTVVAPTLAPNSIVPSPTSVPTETPTTTPTPTPTETPTTTPMPTLTATPIPTATAVPTPATTSIPTATPAPTSLPEPTTTPIPTYAFVAGSDSIKLAASDSSPGKLFGTDVAINANTVIASAHADFDRGTNAGAAVVFTRSGSTWTQQAKLIGTNTGSGDLLGKSVGISGDTVVLGASGAAPAGTDSGSAYVFVRSDGNWIQQAKLVADDADTGDKFGHSVAINGDTIIVGAPSETSYGVDSGAAYVFTRTDQIWTQQAKLTGTVLSVNSMFGWSVDIDDDTVAVGALNNESEGTGSGIAHVFIRTGGVWTEQANLTASDTITNHNFGRSVALSENTLAVGAPGHNSKGANTGAAYVFLRNENEWTEQAKLTASDSYTTNKFGWSITADGDTVVVGATGNLAKGLNSGAVYTYKRNGTSWTEEAKLTATGAAVEQKLGTSVALDGNTLVSGTPGDFQKGTNTGAAHIFTAQIQ